jgi:transcriptional regulator with XRE-family HTH domain
LDTTRNEGPRKSAEQKIGPELKRLREDAGLSLRALAELVGFSASFISQVETGVASPSIASLEKMATALNVTLGDLFTGGGPEPAIVVRANARSSFRSEWSKARIEALVPQGRSGVLEALMVTLDPGGNSSKHVSVARFDQFAMLIKGDVVLTSGADEIRLDRGDTVLIRARTLHRWHNSGTAPAQILIVSARPR